MKTTASFRPGRAVAAAAMLLCACAASAHVTLAQKTAKAGATYRAVLRVGHGCSGSPTHALRVELPAGFQGAKPMPKPGWTLDIRRQALPTPYQSHGRTVEEDVAEIAWTASTPEQDLSDAYYDEFVLQGTLPAQPGPLWFKIVQVCRSGRVEWSQQPVQGTSTEGLPWPAALLEVLPADEPPHAHMHMQ
jgi:periplasmic copper chaperone A